jgi:hypothetical protein
MDHIPRLVEETNDADLLHFIVHLLRENILIRFWNVSFKTQGYART